MVRSCSFVYFQSFVSFFIFTLFVRQCVCLFNRSYSFIFHWSQSIVPHSRQTIVSRGDLGSSHVLRDICVTRSTVWNSSTRGTDVCRCGWRVWRIHEAFAFWSPSAPEQGVNSSDPEQGVNSSDPEQGVKSVWSRTGREFEVRLIQNRAWIRR